MPFHYGKSGSLYYLTISDGEQTVTLTFLDEPSMLSVAVSLENAIDMENQTDG